MADHVYRVTEIVGSSSQSVDAAIRNGIDRPSRRVGGLAELLDRGFAMLNRCGRGYGHVVAHGMTTPPRTRISALEPRPSTPMQIMPSAMSAYCTSE